MKRTRRERPGRAGRILLAAIVSVAMTAGTDIAEAAGEAASPGGFKWKDGAEVYQKVCIYCHEDGKVGPELFGRSIAPAYTQQIVRNGLRAMPAFRSTEIDDDSLVKLADFIFRQKKPLQ